MKNPRNTIKKWYKKLAFRNQFDQEFYQALEARPDIVKEYNIDSYDILCEDGIKNLFCALYCCEALSKKYEALGIGEDVLLDTLSDIPVAANSWYEIKGKLWLGSIRWISNHLKFKLFKIGRLQFCFGEATCDLPEFHISKSEPIMEVHVQEGTPLLYKECEESFGLALVFFDKYFPDYRYNYFTCYSWLLDKTLSGYLQRESNILAFQSFFDIVSATKSDRIFNYVFRRGATREAVFDLTPKTAFAEAIKSAVIRGENFYEGYGIIGKSRFSAKNS